MEPKQNKVESIIAPLRKVTPLSKYLAMIIFIVMPFVGGWIGYTYSLKPTVEGNLILSQQDTKAKSENNRFEDGIVDFSVCGSDMESGGWEALEVVYVLGESLFDERCHVMIYTASAIADGGYQIEECWVPMNLGIATSTKFEPYDDVFLPPSIPREYCTTNVQQGIFRRD